MCKRTFTIKLDTGKETVVAVAYRKGPLFAYRYTGQTRWGDRFVQYVVTEAHSGIGLRVACFGTMRDARLFIRSLVEFPGMLKAAIEDYMRGDIRSARMTMLHDRVLELCEALPSAKVR